VADEIASEKAQHSLFRHGAATDEEKLDTLARIVPLLRPYRRRVTFQTLEKLLFPFHDMYADDVNADSEVEYTSSRGLTMAHLRAVVEALSGVYHVLDVVLLCLSDVRIPVCARNPRIMAELIDTSFGLDRNRRSPHSAPYTFVSRWIYRFVIEDKCRWAAVLANIHSAGDDCASFDTAGWQRNERDEWTCLVWYGRGCRLPPPAPVVGVFASAERRAALSREFTRLVGRNAQTMMYVRRAVARRRCKAVFRFVATVQWWMRRGVALHYEPYYDSGCFRPAFAKYRPTAADEMAFRNNATRLLEAIVNEDVGPANDDGCAGDDRDIRARFVVARSDGDAAALSADERLLTIARNLRKVKYVCELYTDERLDRRQLATWLKDVAAPGCIDDVLTATMDADGKCIVGERLRVAIRGLDGVAVVM